MTEDSQNKQIEQDNEALIQEALRDAKVHELPGELTTNPIVHRGDETLQAPMTVKEISSAGYVHVWDSRTYERFNVLYYMLPQKLRQRRKDGSFRFTTNDPKQEPKHGTIKCLLHLDGENRAHYDELGFRTCPKHNITNPYQLTQHMKKKHKEEWAAIEKEREDKERKEDRALQRLLLEGQIASQVKLKPQQQLEDKTPKDELLMAPRELGDNEYFCLECKSAHRLTSKLGKRHLKYKS